jgi:hypothetical protein
MDERQKDDFFFSDSCGDLGMNEYILRGKCCNEPWTIDYRCVDGRFLLSARGVTILNGRSVSKGEQRLATMKKACKHSDFLKLHSTSVLVVFK